MHLEKKITPKAVVNNDWHSGCLIVLVISAGKLAFKMQLEIHLGDWWPMWLINLSRFRRGPALHHPLRLSSWAVRLVKSSVSGANSSEWLPFRWIGYQDPLFNQKTNENYSYIIPFLDKTQLSSLLGTAFIFQQKTPGKQYNCVVIYLFYTTVSSGQTWVAFHKRGWIDRNV